MTVLKELYLTQVFVGHVCIESKVLYASCSIFFLSNFVLNNPLHLL